MSEVRRDVPTSAAQVWAMLADGWTYSAWVVGASHVRAVDAAWPGVGSRLHHSVGPWPLVVRDFTEVVAGEPGEELELRARAWPFGEARVKISLMPVAAQRCRVTMVEHPVRGPAAWAHNPVAEALLRVRNVESLQRLADLSARRTQLE